MNVRIEEAIEGIDGHQADPLDGEREDGHGDEFIGSAAPDLRAVRRNDYAAFMCQDISAKMLKLVEPCCIPGGRALPKFQRFTACWVLAAALVD